jgi:hypothetical protein
VGAFRKVLSMGFIWLFTFQTSQSVQAEVWDLSAPSAPGVEMPQSVPADAQACCHPRVAHTSRRFLSGCMRPSACRCHHCILSTPKIEPSFQR